MINLPPSILLTPLLLSAVWSAAYSSAGASATGPSAAFSLEALGAAAGAALNNSPGNRTLLIVYTTNGSSSLTVPVIFAVLTLVSNVTSSPSVWTLKSNLWAPSVASVFTRPLLDFNIWMDSYTGMP
uniref:Uncharacterized protein n=1 Tax=Rhizophora mucronata TaxID=61149 RepID=A0A2P2IKE9_RHIMU